jgi:hypothetical protein
MRAPSKDELLRRIRGLSDEDLLKMVTVEADEYRQDALDIARAELRTRGREPPTTTTGYLESLDRAELKDSSLLCGACYASTTDESFPVSGETFMRRLQPGYDPCPKCDSVVRDHAIVVYGFAIKVLARYRVKQLIVPWPGQPKVLASRRLLNDRLPTRPSRKRKRPDRRRS